MRKDFDNGYYDGELSGNIIHGKGSFYFTSGEHAGDAYIGEWRLGERSGHGVYIYACGDRYEGEFLNGKRIRRGRMTYRDGSVYDGEWACDMRHGAARVTFPDGRIYEGTYTNDAHTGSGIMKYRDSVYEGGFLDGERHFEGKERWTSGELAGQTYVGQYTKGKKNGRGSCTWPNGDSYEGDFADDSKTGYGVYTWSNGNIYRGSFLNDKRHGHGVMEYIDGTYEGAWSNNMRTDGKFTSHDGWNYCGKWCDDDWRGSGVYTTANGTVIIGDWKSFGNADDAVEMQNSQVLRRGSFVDFMFIEDTKKRKKKR